MTCINDLFAMRDGHNITGLAMLKKDLRRGPVMLTLRIQEITSLSFDMMPKAPTSLLPM